MGKPVQEAEEISVLEKVLKVLIVLVLLLFLYSYLEPIVAELTANTQRSRMQRDFDVITNALKRFNLNGPRYTDTSLSGLVGKYLQEMPGDPWGNDYAYNWFFNELVSSGPDGVFQTLIPGINDIPPTNDDQNDDWVRPTSPPTRLVYFLNRGDTGRIFRAHANGRNITLTREEAGAIVDVSCLPGSKMLAYTVRREGNLDIHEYDFGSDTYEQLTNDNHTNRSPTWLGDSLEQIVFASDRDGGGRMGLFRMNLSPREVTRLLPQYPGQQSEPWAVSREGRKSVYYRHIDGERTSIEVFNPPSVKGKALRSGAGYMRPSPSPDGQYLAYVIQEGGTARIEVLSLKKDSVIYKRDGVSPDSWVTWSPGSERFAFLIQDRGATRIALTHIGTSRTCVLSHLELSPGRIAWIN